MLHLTHAFLIFNLPKQTNRFKKRFTEFMEFVSDNSDIFKLLELNVQVNIHKISLDEEN
jgi:hypothetical protein